jgi:hypothetical protein
MRLIERLEQLIIRERSFQKDYKELNKVPSNLDYNRVLDMLEKLATEHRQNILSRGRYKK